MDSLHPKPGLESPLTWAEGVSSSPKLDVSGSLLRPPLLGSGGWATVGEVGPGHTGCFVRVVESHGTAIAAGPGAGMTEMALSQGCGGPHAPGQEAFPRE